MTAKTQQQKFWEGSFAKGYIRRNFYDPKGLDTLYMKDHGTTRKAMNTAFLKGIPRDARILEVGTNVGNQLLYLESMGFKNLYGIEFNPKVIPLARRRVPQAHIILGSALDIPFKNSYFDLVFTSEVLIHIAPKDTKRALREICRVSKKYIWGFEYFEKTYTPIVYHGNTNVLWKANFPKLFLQTCKGLTLVKEKMYPFLYAPHNRDVMFLFKKGRA